MSFGSDRVVNSACCASIRTLQASLFAGTGATVDRTSNFIGATAKCQVWAARFKKIQEIPSPPIQR